MTPDPKPRRRMRATVAERRRLRTEKLTGACRVCGDRPSELHHVVSRAQGGDDTADNLVPLCVGCHVLVTVMDRQALDALGRALSLPERVYAARRKSPEWLFCRYGVIRSVR